MFLQTLPPGRTWPLGGTGTVLHSLGRSAPDVVLNLTGSMIFLLDPVESFRLQTSEEKPIKTYLFRSVGDPNPNPNPKGSERFMGSESN